jgi:hypothetical protein
VPQATRATLIRPHIHTFIINRSPIICHCEPFSERREGKAKQSPPPEIAASSSAPRKDRLEESGGQGVEERFVQRVLWASFPWIPAPRLHEDKLRGNDTRGVLLRRTGAWGVPRSLLSPPNPPQADASG